MYNGIGLPTPRGSGTNGYVQKNLSHLPSKRQRVDYDFSSDSKKAEEAWMKKPNQELLEHSRKRMVEVKCMEFQEQLEQQGVSPDVIELKVAHYRKQLVTVLGSVDNTSTGVTDTHHQAQEMESRNSRLQAAFNISSGYKEGSAFDVEAQGAKKLAAAQEKLQREKQLRKEAKMLRKEARKAKRDAKKAAKKAWKSDREKRKSKKAKKTSTSCSQSSPPVQEASLNTMPSRGPSRTAVPSSLAVESRERASHGGSDADRARFMKTLLDISGDLVDINSPDSDGVSHFSPAVSGAHGSVPSRKHVELMSSGSQQASSRQINIVTRQEELPDRHPLSESCFSPESRRSESQSKVNLSRTGGQRTSHGQDTELGLDRSSRVGTVGGAKKPGNHRSGSEEVDQKHHRRHYEDPPSGESSRVDSRALARSGSGDRLRRSEQKPSHESLSKKPNSVAPSSYGCTDKLAVGISHSDRKQSGVEVCSPTRNSQDSVGLETGSGLPGGEYNAISWKERGAVSLNYTRCRRDDSQLQRSAIVTDSDRSIGRTSLGNESMLHSSRSHQARASPNCYRQGPLVSPDRRVVEPVSSASSRQVRSRKHLSRAVTNDRTGLKAAPSGGDRRAGQDLQLSHIDTSPHNDRRYKSALGRRSSSREKCSTRSTGSQLSSLSSSSSVTKTTGGAVGVSSKSVSRHHPNKHGTKDVKPDRTVMQPRVCTSPGQLSHSRHAGRRRAPVQVDSDHGRSESQSSSSSGTEPSDNSTASGGQHTSTFTKRSRGSDAARGRKRDTSPTSLKPSKHNRGRVRESLGGSTSGDAVEVRNTPSHRRGSRGRVHLGAESGDREHCARDSDSGTRQSQRQPSMKSGSGSQKQRSQVLHQDRTPESDEELESNKRARNDHYGSSSRKGKRSFSPVRRHREADVKGSDGRSVVSRPGKHTVKQKRERRSSRSSSSSSDVDSRQGNCRRSRPGRRDRSSRSTCVSSSSSGTSQHDSSSESESGSADSSSSK